MKTKHIFFYTTLRISIILLHVWSVFSILPTFCKFLCFESKNSYLKASPLFWYWSVTYKVSHWLRQEIIRQGSDYMHDEVIFLSVFVLWSEDSFTEVSPFTWLLKHWSAWSKPWIRKSNNPREYDLGYTQDEVNFLSVLVIWSEDYFTEASPFTWLLKHWNAWSKPWTRKRNNTRAICKMKSPFC